MRTRVANWYETKVRYNKTQEDGQTKKVTESYVVDALSFGEAEKKIAEEMSHYTDGEMEVQAITRPKYGEIFFSDLNQDDKWYKATLKFITIDERTEKEKKSTVVYLVQGDSLDTAKKHIDDVMQSTMIDYEVSGITETKVIDVFEHNA